MEQFEIQFTVDRGQGRGVAEAVNGVFESRGAYDHVACQIAADDDVQALELLRDLFTADPRRGHTRVRRQASGVFESA